MSWLREHRWWVLAGAAVLVAVLVVVLVKACGSSSTSSTTTSTSASSTSDLAVVDLQRVMTRLGYYSGPIDGVYGSATTDAVSQMQKALGVTADGVYGPSTSEALKGKGMEVVVQIQTELAMYGYYTGPIDGQYGQATKDAVKKLQTDLGVNPDGLFGAETAAALDKAVADGTLQPSTTTTATTTAETTSTTSATTETTSTTTATTTTTAATTTTQ